MKNTYVKIIDGFVNAVKSYIFNIGFGWRKNANRYISGWHTAISMAGVIL